ncbi:hypothetical protein QJQ45_014579 [Haematococcus lacustris]|nr:hypothetical protein QJQ45_014579 [Haematococcus lacustris]
MQGRAFCRVLSHSQQDCSVEAAQEMVAGALTRAAGLSGADHDNLIRLSHALGDLIAIKQGRNPQPCSTAWLLPLASPNTAMLSPQVDAPQHAVSLQGAGDLHPAQQGVGADTLPGKKLRKGSLTCTAEPQEQQQQQQQQQEQRDNDSHVPAVPPAKAGKKHNRRDNDGQSLTAAQATSKHDGHTQLAANGGTGHQGKKQKLAGSKVVNPDSLPQQAEEAARPAPAPALAAKVTATPKSKAALQNGAETQLGNAAGHKRKHSTPSESKGQPGELATSELADEQPMATNVSKKIKREQQAHVAGATPASQGAISLFPAGSRQAQVALPALFLQVDSQQVMDSPEFCDAIVQSVSAGATGVVLNEAPGTDASSSLYEATVKLKELLRGRAALLLVDRMDITQAAEADGVLLTGRGVPVVVAKRMLASTGGGLVGKIVTSAAAAVTAAADGANLVLITAGDGGPPSAAELAAAQSQQRSGSAIPVIAHLSPPSSDLPDCLERLADTWSQSSPYTSSSSRRSSGGSVSGTPFQGLSLDLALLPLAAAVASGSPDPTPQEPAAAVAAVMQALAQGPIQQPGSHSPQQLDHSLPDTRPDKSTTDRSSRGDSSSSSTSTSSGSSGGSSRSAAGGSAERAAGTWVAGAAALSSSGSAVSGRVSAPRRGGPKRDTPTGSGWARRLASSQAASLLHDEKVTLAQAREFLEEVVPQLAELSLLRDAIRQLDEPFLLVVVGEFNSGKSSVINALLGHKFLAEGILPTTNEISILKYSDEPGAEARMEQQADGLYVRYLPARLLEEVNIVDTPGTNVILERQQRLTEEYVPRADLVLFVMSADRPFSESEVRFLEYIRQWRKKVVFVVNKADMLSSQDEVDEVKSFVSDNARRLLKLDAPPVLAVSSRSALRAKQAAGRTANQVGVSFEDPALERRPEWGFSGFSLFERTIYSFLIGGQAAFGGLEAAGVSGRVGAGEGVRLKLETPLAVADALLGAAGQQLASDLSTAQSELAAVQAVEQQLVRFKADMEKDAAAQRDALLKTLAVATARMDKFVDKTLALSNAVALSSYVTGGTASQQQLSSTATQFEAEVAGGTFDKLHDAVVEHSTWLVANCEAQRSYYASFVKRQADAAAAAGRRMPAVEEALQHVPTPPLRVPTPRISRVGSSSGSSLAALDSSDSSTALAPVADFDLRAAAALLDQELREAVVGTAAATLGAPTLGLLVSSWISNTLEDLVVLGVAGAAAYASVLNLPLRRAEIKGKVARLATSFVNDVQQAMREQLNQELENTVETVGGPAAAEVAGWERERRGRAEISSLVAPLESAAEEEVQRLADLEQQRRTLSTQVQELTRRIADLD